jgi:hypothetical protein
LTAPRTGVGKRDGKGRSAIDNYRGSSPSPGSIGSYESVYKPYYPNVGEGPSTGIRMVRSPALVVKVDTPAMGAFVRLLTIMEKSGFRTVLRYSGPDVAGARVEGEGTPLESLIRALERAGPEVEVGRGLAAVLRDAHDTEVSAGVEVRPGRRTRVRVKVKGRLLATRWEALRRLVRRRFKLAV